MEAAAAPASAGGRVVKRAADPGQAARIAAEAEVLAAGQVPGVVELVGVEGDADRPSLVTVRVPGPDLVRACDLTLDEVAGVAAAVATTLADLHDLGLVHGAVMAPHVLVSGDGRPVLCGFGYGGRAGDTPVAEAPLPESHRDPARRPGNPLAPAADVFALGALVRTLVLEASTPAPSSGRRLRRRAAPSRRRARRISPGPSRPAPPVDRSQRTALLAVADRATAVDPGLRLGARSFAAAVGVAVPGARLPSTPDSGDPPQVRSSLTPAPDERGARRSSAPAPTSFRRANRRENPRDPHARTEAGVGRRRLSVTAGLAAAVVSMLMLGRAVLGRGTGHSETAEPPPATAPPTEAPAAPATTLVPTPSAAPAGATGPAGASTQIAPTATGSACPSPAASLAADTDGDGCVEALRWSDGVLEAGDRRWLVGQPGDRVAAADWSCSGRPTLAVLRPATGEVFVFDGWAEAGRDLVAELAGRVEGAFALRAAELGDGCPRLAVERADGTPVTLPAPARP